MRHVRFSFLMLLILFPVNLFCEARDVNTLLNMGRQAVFFGKESFLPEKTKEEMYIVDYYKDEVYKNFFFGGSSGLIILEGCDVLDEEMNPDEVGVSSFYTEVLITLPVFNNKGFITTDVGFVATSVTSQTETENHINGKGEEERRARVYAELLTTLGTLEFYYQDLINIESTLVYTTKSIDAVTSRYDDSVEQGDEFEELQISNTTTYDKLDLIKFGVLGKVLHGETPWDLRESQYSDIQKYTDITDTFRLELGHLSLDENNCRDIYSNLIFLNNERRLQWGGGFRYSYDDNVLDGLKALFVYKSFKTELTYQFRDIYKEQTDRLGVGTGVRLFSRSMLNIELMGFYNYQPYLDAMPDLADSVIITCFLNTLL